MPQAPCAVQHNFTITTDH